MKLPGNLRETLSKNLATVLAVFLIVVMALGLLLVITTSIMPAVKSNNSAAADLQAARDQLAKTQGVQGESPESLQKKLVAAQATLSDSLKIFLPDYQASQIVDALYQKASNSGVAIIDFQTQVTPAQGPKPLYTVTGAKLKVQGISYDLVRYVSALNELSVKGLALNTVHITTGQTFASLALDLTLYTSPYAPLQTIPDSVGIPLPPTSQPATIAPQTTTPTPLPPNVTPTPDPVALLTASLDSYWAAKNWPEAIRAIEQLLILQPNNLDWLNKLYSAHVNLGFFLQGVGDTTGARQEFLKALTVKPDGGEAIVALRGLGVIITPATPTPSGLRLYVVQPGDTLFSIAERFNVQLPALMQANNLTSFGVIVGQQLIIP